MYNFKQEKNSKILQARSLHYARLEIPRCALTALGKQHTKFNIRKCWSEISGKPWKQVLRFRVYKKLMPLTIQKVSFPQLYNAWICNKTAKIVKRLENT